MGQALEQFKQNKFALDFALTQSYAFNDGQNL